jgi:hypothetical protein
VCAWHVLRLAAVSGNVWYGPGVILGSCYGASCMPEGREKNGVAVSAKLIRRIFIVLFVVKRMKIKAGFTVEAALVCPFLCLILCGMIQFTLCLYGKVDVYAAQLVQQQIQELSSNRLIRLEAVTEEIF